MTAGNEEQLVSNVFQRKTPVDKKAKERKVESTQFSFSFICSLNPFQGKRHWARGGVHPKRVTSLFEDIVRQITQI